MRRLLRLAGSSVALALALTLPAGANRENVPGYPWHVPMNDTPPGGTVTALVIRISGGFHPSERWIWYGADGTVRLKGVVGEQRGLYRARFAFSDVVRIADETGLCTRQGMFYRPPGMDMVTYHLHVRCGEAWRSLSTGDLSEPDDAAQASRAVHVLRRMSETLAWKTSEENVAPPDVGGLFHTARSTGSKTPPAPR